MPVQLVCACVRVQCLHVYTHAELFEGPQSMLTLLNWGSSGELRQAPEGLSGSSHHSPEAGPHSITVNKQH